MLSPRPLSFTGESFEGGGGEEEGSPMESLRSEEEDRQEANDVNRIFPNEPEVGLEPEILDIIDRFLSPSVVGNTSPSEEQMQEHQPLINPPQEQRPIDMQQAHFAHPQPMDHQITQPLPIGDQNQHMHENQLLPDQSQFQRQPFPLDGNKIPAAQDQLMQQQVGPIQNQQQFKQHQPMQQQQMLHYIPPQDQIPVQQVPPENMMKVDNEPMQQQQQQQHPQQHQQQQQQQQPYFPPPQPQQIHPQQQQMNGGPLLYQEQPQQHRQQQQQQHQPQFQQQQPQNGGDRRDWQLEPYRPLPAYQQLPQQDQSAYLNYHHQYLIPFHNQADFQLNLNQGVNPYQTVQGQTTQTSQGCLPHARERASNRNPYYREERKERKSHNQGSPTATTNPSLPYFQPFPAQFDSFPGVMDTPGPSNGFPQLNIPSTSNGTPANGLGIALNGNGVATLPMYSFSSSNASGFNGQLVSGITTPNGEMPSTSVPTANGNSLSTEQTQAEAHALAQAEAAKLEAKKKKKEAQMREEFEHEQRNRDMIRQMSLASTKVYGYQPPPDQKGGAKLEGLPTGVVPSGGIRNSKPRKPRSDVLVSSSNANSSANEDSKEGVTRSNALVPLIKDGIPVRRPDHSSTCGEVVVFLMQYCIQHMDYDFSSKALESLHKKLKDRPGDLEMFIRVIESRGKFVGECITVTRTLDGRLQVAGRKGFPHVIYSKLFRFQDLHKNELRAIPCCHYGFENKAEEDKARQRHQQGQRATNGFLPHHIHSNEEHKPDAQVCINPYHYERVTPQSGASTLIDPNTGLLRINGIPSMDEMMDMGNSSNNHLKMLPSDSTTSRKMKKASKRKGLPGDWPVISLDDDEEGIPKEDDVESQYRVEFPEDGDRPPLLQQQQQAAHDHYMHQLQYNHMAAAFPGIFPPGLFHIGPVQFPTQPMQQPQPVQAAQQLQIAPAPIDNPIPSAPAPVPQQPRQSEEAATTMHHLHTAPPTKHARPDLPQFDPTGATSQQQQYPAHLQQEYLQQAAQAQIRPSPFNPAVAMPQTAPTYIRPVFPTAPVHPTPLSVSLSSMREGTERIPPLPSQAAIPDVRAPSLPVTITEPSEAVARPPTTTVASLPDTVVVSAAAAPKLKPTMEDADEYQARLYRSITRDRILLEAEEKKEREAAPVAAAAQPPITSPDLTTVKQSVRTDSFGNEEDPEALAIVNSERMRVEAAEARKQARKEHERRQTEKESKEALKRVPTTMEMKEEILRLQGYWEKRNEQSKDDPHPPFEHPNRSRSAGVSNTEQIDKFGGDLRPSSSKSARSTVPQEQMAIQIVRTSADNYRAELTGLTEVDRRTADMITQKKELNDEEKVYILKMIHRKSKADKAKEREKEGRLIAEQFVAAHYPATVERVAELLKCALEEGRRQGRQPAKKNYALLSDLEKLARDKPGFLRENQRHSRPARKTNADGVARSTSNEPSTSNSITMEESQVGLLRSLSLERRGETGRLDPHFLNAHPSLLESLRLSNASVLGGFGLNALEIKTEEIDPPKDNPHGVPSPRTVTQIALEKAKEIVKSEESDVGLPPENRILGGGDGAEMMANLINYGSEFSEPASEMRGCFEKMILAGTKTLTKDKLAKELEVAHQQLTAMKAELEEEDERSIHSDDDISEYALELQDRYKFRREIMDRIEDKEKDIHAMSKRFQSMKTAEEKEEEKRHLINPTIWNSEYTNDNDEPTYSRTTECVGAPPNPRVAVPATGPGTYGSKGPHLKNKSKLKILEWSVQQIVMMMEKVAKDSDINSVQYMLCCQHYAGMMERTQGAASLDPSQVKLVRAAIDAAQKMGGGDVTNQQLHVWDISRIFQNHMMTIPERRQLKERKKNAARLEQTKPEWEINIEAELDKVIAAAVGTDAEGLFSKNEVRKALEKRQRIIRGEKIVPDELMDCEELKNPVAKAFDNARKVMRTEDGIESEMESNDHSLNCMDEENTGEPMDMDPLLPVVENLFSPEDLIDLLQSPVHYMQTFRDAIFGEDPPPIDFEERQEIRDVAIPPKEGYITYEPFDGVEREHDDPDEFGEERPPLKKNCRCPEDKKRRDHCFWGKHNHYIPGCSREIIDAAFILYRYRIKRKKSKGVNGALYNFSMQFNCPRVCMNRASEIEPHSAKSKPLGYNWAAVNYCERDNHVGLLRQVESVNFFIDGGFDTDTEQRYCISNTSHMLTRFDREVHEVRGKIGCGVRLSVKDDGSMWVRVMSRYPVFISSTYLDREAGFVTGDAVHKVYPGTAIKAFDLVRARRAILQMYDYQLEAMKGTNGEKPRQELPYPLTEFSRRELRAVARIGADDMHRHAVVKIGFVKGWGPEFQYKRICETPCWVEIINNRACEFIDHVMSTREVSYAFSEADSSDFDD